MKKTLALILALLMLVSMSTACSNSKTDDTSSSSSSTTEKKGEAKTEEKKEETKKEEPKKEEPKKEEKKEDTPPATSSDSDDVPVITIFVTETSDINYPYSFTDMPALVKIHDLALEQYGINLELETAISSEFETILNTRFASGESLPDVINYRYPSLQLNQVYRNGLILSIDDYPHPNFDEFLEEVPYLRVANGSSDGKLLRFCEVFFNPSHITMGLNVRKDWLDELGMELPTTTEELREAVKIFQENDMNGDGLPNEQLAFADWYSMNYVLACAFGVQKLTRADDSWCYDDGNNVYHSMVTPEAKEYCAYIASLYNEGLIWENFLNYTTEDYSAFKMANRYAGSCGRNWDGVLLPTEMNGYGLSAVNTPIIPITDGIHEPASVITNYGGSQGVMFTKDCDVPETCIAFWDYFYTVEGHQLRYYGEVAPGGDYYVKDDSQALSLGVSPNPRGMTSTDKYREESAKEPNLRGKLGINLPLFPSGSIGSSERCVVEYYFTFTPEICGESATMEYMVPVYNWHLENGTYEMSMVAADEDQSKVLSDHVDLFAYMDEQIKAFQTGVRPIDEWDDYVATCEGMGLAECIEVQQQRYNAYLKAFGA